jgi:hypothetical protein
MKPRSRRRDLSAVLGLIALVSLVALSTPSAAVKPKKKKAVAIKACADKRTGEIRLARKGRRCGKGGRRLTWNVRGPKGPRGPKGAPGKKAAGGVASTTIFTARAGNYVSTLMNPGFASVTGPTVITATESLAQTLAPTTPFAATNLSVRSTAAPGIGNSVTLTLRDEAADTPLSCTISGSATTCTNTNAAAAIPGSSALSLEVTSSGSVPTLSLFVGFQGR